ncbi:MAG: hypothetical protein PHV43_02240 [Candidatus Colwellbacteria bacterium]|nr:hypothetical protein [Candidatus Colwellbacteria bacterium]
MKKILYILAGAVLLSGVASVSAATFAGEDNYLLGANESVAGNLYTAGGNVNISGNVEGDLITAGGNLTIAGDISEDLTVVGGTINVISNVGEDVRIAGGNINISGKIGGELVGAGGQVNILSSSAVQGDLNLNGGMVRVEAPVQGRAEINGGTVYLNTLVAGNLVVRGDEIALGPNADIKGNFTYYSKSEASINASAQIAGETKFNRIETPVGKGIETKSAVAVMAGLAALKILMTAITAIFLVYVWKGWTKSFAKDVTNNFWGRALLGFAALILTPVAAVLLMITFIGLIPAGILWLGYFMGILLASVLAGVLTAVLFNKYVLKKPVDDLPWWKVFLGVALFQLVKIIPFLGWLAAFVIFLAVLGWLTKTVTGTLSRGRK